ncbi:MAG: CvpA family protein, partial [Eubacteriales bacterium]|nr:CvpA family protein [Eubacteriales bacterium]
LVDQISTQLANLVCDIISVILLFIAARLAFILLKFVVKGIAKLPVFKQLDKIGGFALGAVEGLLTVYILLAVLTMTSANPKMEKVFKAVDNSLIGHSMYQNNFIVSSMLPKAAQDNTTGDAIQETIP